MYDVVQLPDDNAHAGGLNVPPAPLSFHSIVPVGVAEGFVVSLTVTVSVTADPGFVVDELGDTVTVVESRVLETDVLLLSVNIMLLLSAIAGRIVKPFKSDELRIQNIRKTGATKFRIFSLPNIFHLSDATRLFFSYICSLKGFLR